MDERNCGFCMPCAIGNYEQCETRKDERLIAAAPELLEALEALSAWTESTKCKREIGGLVHYKLLASCKAAIAKARGE